MILQLTLHVCRAGVTLPRLQLLLTLLASLSVHPKSKGQQDSPLAQILPKDFVRLPRIQRPSARGVMPSGSRATALVAVRTLLSLS